ncbi:uncharacterized protein MELLADRAFT_67632 [Melampsora larici-populina 98AG31]|uniref:Uncharacterized protein n=1 Tax=Melampsora larici-populina (strain 98AG31 / pathotype 3-4-7) TaxID=747676 RepID=F4S3V6_MELLP|nr:uncharacterized protein MELLADRAFT_67632 [Melampsora larici-populina 98AG31]EGG00675.1 hypothetical protein MELLADRAFT_67632 [Melampsora larici-populina 98AG31]
MTQTYTRRALFKAVLNGCPTFLGRVDANIREEVIQDLTETPKTKWSKETSLQRDTYEIWLNYLNFELDQRYGQFYDYHFISNCSPTLPTVVETTTLLKICGKNYTSNQRVKGKGNSAIEYCIQGQRRFGYIKYAFRSKVVPTVFLAVDQFTQLNASDSARDCFVSHPRLQAARVYSKIERTVVVDVHDLMGHIIVLPYLPGHLGIAEETLGIVGLRNILASG